MVAVVPSGQSEWTVGSPSQNALKKVFCHLLRLPVLVGDDIRLGRSQNTKEQQLLTANVTCSAQYT